MGLLKPQSGGGGVKVCVLSGGIQKPIYTDGKEFIWGKNFPSATQLTQVIYPLGSIVNPTNFNPLQCHCAIYSSSKSDLLKILDIQLYASNGFSTIHSDIGYDKRRTIYTIVLDGLEYFYFPISFIYLPLKTGTTVQTQILQIFYKD